MTWQNTIDSCADEFKAIADESVDWTTERGHIIEAFTKDFRLPKATEISIKNAILNIAHSGITINPLYGYAHLEARSVNTAPKDKPAEWRTDVSLKFSYKGAIQALVRSGDVTMIRADVVRKGDNFVYNGPYKAPDVSVSDPFSDSRHQVVGSYAIAKYPDGSVMCEIMRMEELAEVERCSQASSGPWKNEFKTEMYKKSNINRLVKTIPTKSDHMQHVVSIVSEGDGIKFDAPEPVKTIKHTPEQEAAFSEAIKANEGKGDGYALIAIDADADQWASLFNTFQDGDIVRMKDKVRTLMRDSHDAIKSSLVELKNRMSADDQAGAQEILGETPWNLIAPRADSELDSWIKQIGDKAP